MSWRRVVSRFWSTGVNMEIELKFEKGLSKSVLYILSSQVQRENILRLSKGLGFVLFVVLFEDVLGVYVAVEGHEFSVTFTSYVVASVVREVHSLHGAACGGRVQRSE